MTCLELLCDKYKNLIGDTPVDDTDKRDMLKAHEIDNDAQQVYSIEDLPVESEK